MNGGFIHILGYLTRLLASTAIIPTALVAGMLSFPTACQCGADHSHGHSIFEMPGHYHGERPKESADREVARAGVDGATVQTPIGNATPALAAVQTASTAQQPLPRASLVTGAEPMPAGLQLTPDVPPPQV
jgi:hypothetical protein